MRVYRYSPGGEHNIPDGGLHCVDADTKIVGNRDIADVFIIPCHLFQLGPRRSSATADWSRRSR